MAQVSLQINGFRYVLGCGDGEEDHLMALAADLDRRIEELKAANGAGSEARLLVMAALMLADELHDLKSRPGGTPELAARGEPKAAKRLRGLTKKAETLADAADSPLTDAIEAVAEPREGA